MKRKSYVRQYLQGSMFGPYSFINVVGGKEEKDDAEHSRRNMVEVAVVVKILQNLYKGMSTYCTCIPIITLGDMHYNS